MTSAKILKIKKLVFLQLTGVVAHHVGVDDRAHLAELVLEVLPRGTPREVADEAALACLRE